MVNVGDLGQINALYQEAGSIDRGLQNFSEGGRITGMTIGPGTPAGGALAMPPRLEATVSTVGWSYPEQMQSTIIQQLHDRRAAIDTELRQLGVAGLAAQEQAR